MSRGASIEFDTEELNQHGFVILPGLISRRAAAELAGIVEGVFEREASGVRPHSVRHIASRVSETRTFAGSPPVASVVMSALGTPGRLVRSILFDKVPGANWKVSWHQDLTIAVSERRDVEGYGPWSLKDGVASVQPPVPILDGMVTVRVHLDDCGPENGPIRVIPGSHRLGRLTPEGIDALVAENPFVVCSCDAGDALVMKPLILHASSPAIAPLHRRIIHLEFATSGPSGGLKWSTTV